LNFSAKDLYRLLDIFIEHNIELSCAAVHSKVATAFTEQRLRYNHQALGVSSNDLLAPFIA